MDVTRWGDGVAADGSHFAQGPVRLIHVVLTRDDKQVRDPTMAVRVDEIHYPAINLLLGRKCDEKIHHFECHTPGQWRQCEIRQNAAPRHHNRTPLDVAIVKGV
jgi:hypothetical protein